MSQEELRSKLQKIVENIETIEPVAGFNSDQWERGNANIRRTDKSISTLNVNIKANEYAAGINGKDKGKAFDFLKKNFKLNNKNSQNELYKIPVEKIKTVIDYYASIGGTENMDTKEIHSKALGVYLRYYDPTHQTFYLRKNKTKELVNGYWFQEKKENNYVATSPFKPADNNNKTQRICFYSKK